MDARREWEAEEQWTLEWCQKRGLILLLVLNKADKLSRSDQSARLKRFQSRFPEVLIHLVSAMKKTGVEGLEEDIFRKMVHAE